MDRKTFYYRRKVLEEDLNVPFDAVELYDWNYAIDTSSQARTPTSAKDNFGGIAWGYAVTDLGWPSVQFASGAAYDELGRRVATGGVFTLHLTKDGNTVIGMGGVATGSNIAPADGYERWISVFVVYSKKDEDLNYDGYNEPIYFTNTESFYFEIVAGAEFVTGTMSLDPSADGPAREANKVLLCDVHVKTVGTTTTIEGIHKVSSGGTYGTGNRRMEWAFTFRGSRKEIPEQGNWRDALTMLAGYYDAHVDGTADKHSADVIEFSPAGGPVWADTDGGSYGTSTEVEAALKGIVEDLNSIVAAGSSDASGAAKIGIKATSGSTLQNTAAAAFELPEDDLQAALDDIQVRLNGLVFRGGDEEILGTLAPNTSGVLLGTVTKRWQANLAATDIEKSVASGCVLEVSNTNTGAGATAIEATTSGSSGPAIWGYALDADGVYGSSDNGIGVKGTSTDADAISGTSTGTTGQAGVKGTNNAAASFGVDGQSTDGTGVRGQSTDGTGISGQSTYGIGVYGESSTDTGVHGESSTGAGVKGVTNNTTHPAILGDNTATNGIGIKGTSVGATSKAVQGESTLGYGVHGISTDNYGVVGASTDAYGVLGLSTTENAVVGLSSATDKAGVYGNADAAGAIGVSGYSAAGTGVQGQSNATGKAGVRGYTAVNGAFGILGETDGAAGAAVYGKSHGNSSFSIFGSAYGVDGVGIVGSANHASAIGAQCTDYEHLDKRHAVIAIPLSCAITTTGWESTDEDYIESVLISAELTFEWTDAPSNCKIESIAIRYNNADASPIPLAIERKRASFTTIPLAGGSVSTAVVGTASLITTAGNDWIYITPSGNQSMSRTKESGGSYTSDVLRFNFISSAIGQSIYGIWVAVSFYSVSPYHSSFQTRVTP